MPVEVTVEMKNGKQVIYYIPLKMMRGEKSFKDQEVVVLSDWGWATPTYGFSIDVAKEKIASIRINDGGMVADVDQTNDFVVVE